MKTQFKHLNLLGWLVIIFTVFLFGLLAFTLNKTEPERIKPYQVDTVCVDECGWCEVVKTYSLNINNKHIGEK